MSSFVNFLKNLLSGVFSFFGGLFSSKKSQAAIAESAPKPRKAGKSGYFLELDDAKGIGAATATPAKAAVATPPQTSKSVQSKPSKAKAASAAEPAPAAAHVANNAAALNLPQPTVTTFAPKYLAPIGSSNGRRRPGANMSSFLDMARQVKTSS